jgi:hypothetical protein
MPQPAGRSLQELKVEIDQIPELSGAGIGYIGDGACTVLRETQHQSGLKTWVLLQEQELPDQVPLPEARTVPEPNLKLELVGAGLNCAGAVLSWAALGGELLAGPASGGASLGLTVLTWSAAISTSVQCGVSLVRSTDVLVHKGEWTRWLDSNEYVAWASYALDFISLAGVAASASSALRAVGAIRRATNRAWTEILKQMSRAERKRLAEELIRLEYPGISNSGLKELTRMGKFPARLQAAEVSERLFTQLKDAIAASLAFGSSATAGAIHYLYVHVFQE